MICLYYRITFLFFNGIMIKYLSCFQTGFHFVNRKISPNEMIPTSPILYSETPRTDVLHAAGEADDELYKSPLLAV